MKRFKHGILGMRMLNHVIILVLVLNGSLSLAAAQERDTANRRLEVVVPETVGVRSEQLSEIDQVVAKAIAAHQMPGCVVAVGRRGKLVWLKAYGNKRLEPNIEPMSVETVFDLASLTKPIATATSLMKLWEKGMFRLDDRLSKYIPEFGAKGKQDITIRQLLIHQAGLIPDNSLKDYANGESKAFERIYNLPVYVKPGTKFVYSDVGFILLADLVRRLSGQDIHEYSRDEIFEPLGMNETMFIPNQRLKQRSAPTEKRNGQWIQGVVHDPRAFQLGGVAGHAGLFSTVDDLALFAQMLVNGGFANQRRILNPQTVETMTGPYPVSSGVRGLGWDKKTGFSSNRGENLSESAFGHGGFTGTVLWVDPEQELFYIFLSNRVHPSGTGSVNRVAGRIGTIASAAIDPKIDVGRPVNGNVSTGLDRLIELDFSPLKNQRIGLITNQTGITSDGRSNVEMFMQSKNANLVALFSPEHGFLGKLDHSKIGDGIDESTGLNVYSLYGRTRQPTSDQLARVDCLVFDIQDIGTRFYTYISTMGLAMKAASLHKKRFVVLDRPNPIGGTQVSGPMLDADQKSFVGFHPMPIRHGMTVGEIARFLKTELKLELDLEIVELRGWRRGMEFDQTGLPWVNPSPNMRTLNQAFLYPGIGLLEMTNLSVGRGTDTPFEIIGAPWMNGIAIARVLNSQQLSGVRFLPRKFTPSSSKFENQSCSGFSILITARSSFEPIKTGLTIASVLRDMYPEDWNYEGYLRLLGNKDVFTEIRNGSAITSAQYRKTQQFKKFLQRRKEALLYMD